MYEGFYRLHQNPFRLTPDPAFMYLTAQHREALAGLVYSAHTRPGFTILVGEAGTGKTTVLRTLERLLTKRRFLIAECNNPTLTREEFYDLLMLKFGVDCQSSLKSRQLVAFQQLLLRNQADGKPSVLIVDEGQRLSPVLLEEIRLLLNLETATDKLLEIIIAGQPEMLETFRQPELRQLKQRISRLCRLEPLTLADVRAYIDHRLNNSGSVRQDLFDDACVELIYTYTQGIPRLINSLCDAALQIGFALRSERITASIIEEGARDLDLVRPSVNACGHVPAAVAAATVNGKTPAVHGLGVHGAGDHATEQMPIQSYTTELPRR